jgi:hypothetical protein
MDWKFILLLVLGVAALIATIMAIWFAVRLAKKKEPVWAYKTKPVIGKGSDAPEELQILFAGIPVNEVYRTIFIFYNRGNESIRDNDVKSKVAVQFGQALILREPVVVKPSRLDIKFLAKKAVDGANQFVELDFSFLDHDDGAVVEVLHTQNEPEQCSGTIVGAKQIERVKEFVPYKRLDLAARLKKPDSIIGMFFALLWYGFVLYLSLKAKSYGLIAIVFGATAFFLLLGLLSHYRRNKFPKWTSTIEF